MPIKNTNCTLTCCTEINTNFCPVLNDIHRLGFFTHMAFAVNSRILLFAVGLTNPHFPSKDWRIGYIDANTQTWQLFDTGLPEGTVECSPTAYIDEVTNKIVVCFLASTPDNPTYFLYRMTGQNWHSLNRAHNTGVATYHGFVNNRLFASSQFLPNDDIHIHIQHKTGKRITLVAANQYVHKVSYLAEQPTKLIVSLQKKENPRHAKELLIDTENTATLCVIKSPTHKLYKASLHGDTIFYSEKLFGYDTRRIRVTRNLHLVEEPLQCHLALIPDKHG